MASKSAKKKKGSAKGRGGGFPTVAVVVTVAVIVIGAIIGALIWNATGKDDIELVDNIELPSYTRSADAPSGTVKAYQVALTIPDDLAQIPCYCGCGDNADHKNNLECFIEQRNGDNVIFDDHAAY